MANDFMHFDVLRDEVSALQALPALEIQHLSTMWVDAHGVCRDTGLYLVYLCQRIKHGGVHIGRDKILRGI